MEYYNPHLKIICVEISEKSMLRRIFRARDAKCRLTKHSAWK